MRHIVAFAVTTILATCLSMHACHPFTSFEKPCPPCPSAFECHPMSGLCEANTQIHTHYGDEGTDVPQ